jgi:hypothetical protein
MDKPLQCRGIVYRMHCRVKRRINNEVSEDDEIITVYVIQV